jgi:hypothetical protein
VRSFLDARASTDAFTGTTWNNLWGEGKLQLGDMLDPAVAVTFANGGEVLFGGDDVQLEWTSSDNVGVTGVDVELSRDGGSNWEVLATSVPDTGAYAWTVTLPETDEALLRVTVRDAAGNTDVDVSDAAWEIVDQATPALLSMFTARTVERGVELRWRFGEPEAVSAQFVERSASAEGPWARARVEFREEGGQQIALDSEVEPGATYYYRLVVVRRDGERLTFGPLAGNGRPANADFAISSLGPNPMRDAATIEYTLPEAAEIALDVLDVQGRVVAKLARGLHRPGRHHAVWNGESDRGRAPSGLYFVSFGARGRTIVKRLVVAR